MKVFFHAKHVELKLGSHDFRRVRDYEYNHCHGIKVVGKKVVILHEDIKYALWALTRDLFIEIPEGQIIAQITGELACTN